jgi:hypothetical protein
MHGSPPKGGGLGRKGRVEVLVGGNGGGAEGCGALEVDSVELFTLLALAGAADIGAANGARNLVIAAGFHGFFSY